MSNLAHLEPNSQMLKLLHFLGRKGKLLDNASLCSQEFIISLSCSKINEYNSLGVDFNMKHLGERE